MRIEGNGYGYKNLKDKSDSISRDERIAKLKKQIENDSFHPDIQDVAKKILKSSDARRELGFDVKV